MRGSNHVDGACLVLHAGDREEPERQASNRSSQRQVRRGGQRDDGRRRHVEPPDRQRGDRSDSGVVSMSISVTEAWDVEYATGTRYTPDEPPVGFAADILAVAKEHGIERGLYVGAGNGRNFIPMSDAGLELTGLDISMVAIDQLKE